MQIKSPEKKGINTQINIYMYIILKNDKISSSLLESLRSLLEEMQKREDGRAVTSEGGWGNIS